MKRRLILVMQYPVFLRYSDWWFTEFPRQLSKIFSEVIVLGKDYNFPIHNQKLKGADWTPIVESLKFENYQIKEYLNLELRDSDVLFVADLSFQESFISQLYFKRPNRCFAYCHGTSKNFLDVFNRDRNSKWLCETGHSILFKKIFVGSEYHKQKLGWDNILVIGLPRCPFIMKIGNDKIFDVVSVARRCAQKITESVERYVESELKKFIVRSTKIKDWFNYIKFLNHSKVLLISSREDTFNYTILDALQCGCIPIAPRKLCFPEILPDYLLYSDKEEAVERIRNVLLNKVQISDIKLLNEDLVSNFYLNLCWELNGID